MSNYFQHGAISNSDLKKFKQQVNGGGIAIAEDRLQEIYDFGSTFHRVILEPNLITDDDRATVGFELAQKMGKTFFADPLCRMLITHQDFEREKEFYETIEVGGMQIEARCKADGYVGPMGLYIELKGLAVTSQKAFNAAIDRLDYDQAVVHYMLTSRTKICPIVGISKKDPTLLFKKIVKKHDETYAAGEQKLIESLQLLSTFSPEDVKFV